MPDNNNSFFGNPALAPFAIGAGVTGYRAFQDVSNATTYSSTISNMRDVANKAGVNQSFANTSQQYKDFLNTQFTGGKNANVAKVAWNAALEKADPITRERLLQFTNNLETMADKDAIMAINNAIRNNQSIGNQHIFSTFRSNVGTLKHQQRINSSATLGFAELPSNAGLNSFKAINRGIPKHLSADVKSIFDAFGGGALSRFHGTKKGDLGYYRFTLTSAPGGNVMFNLPISKDGIVLEGRSLQTQRIAPKVSLLEGKTLSQAMSREQFYLETIKRTILPDLQSGRLNSNRAIQRAFDDVYNEVYGKLEATSHIPPSRQTVAQQLRLERRKNYIQVQVPTQRVTEGRRGFVGAFRGPEGMEGRLAQELGGFFGGISPTAASRGIFSTEDISQLFLAGEAKDWGRRPEGIFRDYQMTAGSMNRLRDLQGIEEAGKYAGMQSPAYLQELERLGAKGPVMPSLATMYIDPEKRPDLIEELKLREGHFGMTQDAADALRFESTKPMTLKRLREDLVDKVGKGAIAFQPGETIGTDIAGNIVTAKSNMQVLGLEPIDSKSVGNAFQLHYRETVGFRHGDKIFGATRATALVKEQSDYERAVQKTLRNNQFNTNVQMYMNMEDLKKDRGLFRRQMLTSMAELSDPSSVKNVISSGQKLSSLVGGDDTLFVQALMKGGRNLSSTQFGQVFGTVPYVLGQDVATKLATTAGVSSRHIGAMGAGVARGIADIAYDLPADVTGAGRALGSIEPRTFDILAGPAWKGAGSEMSAELTERLIATNPEKYIASQEIGKTLGSMAGQIKPGADANIFDPSSRRDFQSWAAGLGDEGGWIRQGQGLSDVYVPSQNVVDKMRPFQTADGQNIIGSLTKHYQALASNAGGMYSDIDPLSPMEARKEMLNIGEDLRYHWAPGGKGFGGYLRGQLAGSRYLRAMSMSATGETISDMRTAGITQDLANNLFTEMEDIYGRSQMDEMRQAFTAGESIPGLITRHPQIGQFSVQPTWLKKVAGESSQVILPELQRNIQLTGGENIPVRLGPALGLALDYDADPATVSLVSPDNQDVMRRNMLAADSEFNQAYMQHQLRYQIVKAGKPAGGLDGLTLLQKMQGDVSKLAVTEQYVPQLSNQLSEIKMGLTRFSSGTGAADALALTEWLEQVPISAKHISAQQAYEGAPQELMQKLSVTLKSQQIDRNSLTSIVENIVKGNEVARRALTSDLRLSEASASMLGDIYGTEINPELRSANLASAVDEIARTREMSAASALQEHKILTGKSGRANINEVARMANMTPRTGLMGNITEGMLSLRNQAGAAGHSIIKNYKPLGIGLAATMAIGLALSSPRESIGPGNNLNGAAINMRPGKSADSIKKETMMPPAHSRNNLSNPNMVRQGRVWVGGENENRNLHVDARIGSDVNTRRLIEQLQLQNNNTQISVNDNRDNLSPHRLVNKLF